MSYATIAKIATDPDLFPRLVACAAQEGKPKPFDSWVQTHTWELAVTPGWEEAYSYALNAGNVRPGADEGVITDSMILGAVQRLV